MKLIATYLDPSVDEAYPGIDGPARWQDQVPAVLCGDEYGHHGAPLHLTDPGSHRGVKFKVVEKIPNKCVERRNGDFDWKPPRSTLPTLLIHVLSFHFSMRLVWLLK